MVKNIDQQIKDAMATKVVGRTTEIYKAVVLELYQRITANSLQVGLAYGSPVLTGRYYTSHIVARGRIDTTVREPNPDGDIPRSRPAPDPRGGALTGCTPGSARRARACRLCAPGCRARRPLAARPVCGAPPSSVRPEPRGRADGRGPDQPTGGR